MDISASIEPRSDQLNADDLIAGPATYMVREVVQGKAEQPFDFLLYGTERAYRPNKTMRKLIAKGWGTEASTYANRCLTLYREPGVVFGGKAVGGIRISHMSHIDEPFEAMLQTTRGKRELFKVQPLPRLEALKVEWKTADAERRAAIETEVAELKGGAA